MAENKKSLSAWKGMVFNSWRISKMIWLERKGLVLAILFVFIIVSAAPFLQSGSRALLINELVDVEGSGVIGSRLAFLIIALVLAVSIPSFMYALQSYLGRLFWFFLEEKFDLLVVKRKGEIDIASHEDPKKNDLFNKVSENGVWRLQGFVDRQFYILQGLIGVAFASVVLIFSQWWLFIIIFLAMIPELLIEVSYGRMVWGIYSSRAEVRRRFWNLRSHFDQLSSLVELKLFQNTGYFFSIIKELFHNFRNEEKKNDRRKLFFQFLALLLSQSVVAFAAVWFILQVVDDKLMVGTLTFILASIGDLRYSLYGLFSSLGKQYQDSLFVSDVFELIDTKPAIIKPEKGVVLDKKLTPEIVFENVTFGYPRSGKTALKNFSLKIFPGEKVALVGVNGAGKTTFVKLLCRFYDPNAGCIKIGGRDLREIDLNSFYFQLGAIFQDYAHYHFLVKEAIAAGRTEQSFSLEKVREAAQSSEADIFIEGWEDKYDQMLGREFSGGVEPSIGQWQKLALARTFYRDPRILILDEPTSSIDAEAEAKIFEKLEKLPKDRTVILISHRFSTVRRADKIAVMEKGRVAELGTHEELLKLDGTYARLFNLQAKGYR